MTGFVLVLLHSTEDHSTYTNCDKCIKDCNKYLEMIGSYERSEGTVIICLQMLKNVPTKNLFWPLYHIPTTL